mmetsp:Transcript_21269/g.21570  ORF Transcript_21269/g.21570 Transcript_21269/m.21570 type:complete len:214 (-) Transcript_21269:499-1140(-)
MLHGSSHRFVIGGVCLCGVITQRGGIKVFQQHLFDNSLGFLVIVTGPPDLTLFRGGKPFPPSLPQNQFHKNHGQNLIQINLQTRFVQRCVRFRPRNVFRGKLYGSLGIAIDINESYRLVIAGYQHVHVAEIKGLDSHEGQIPEGVEERYQKYLHVDQCEILLQLLHLLLLCFGESGLGCSRGRGRQCRRGRQVGNVIVQKSFHGPCRKIFFVS